MKKVLYAAAAALILAGQWALLKGQVGAGLLVSAAGLLALGLALGLLEPLMAALRSLKRPAPAVPAARGGRSKAASKASVEPAIAGVPLLERVKQLVASDHAWAPVDELLVPSWSLLVPGGLALLLAQWMVMRGKLVGAAMLMVVAALFAVLFAKARHRPIVIPKLNANLKALAFVFPGLLVQLLGMSMLAEYKQVTLGYGIVLVGGALSLLALRFKPFDLATEWVPKGDLGITYHMDEQRLVPPWGFKAAWLGGAALSYLLARQYAVSHPYVGVSLGFLSIVLLLASFPWFNGSLAALRALPERVRYGMALVAALGAVYLGFKAQALMDAGAVHPGLWRFLFAGILLVLALEAPSAARPQGVHMDQGSGPWALRLEILGVLALFLVAMQARIWHVGIFPFGAEGDEAGGGYWAIDALKGRVENPFVSANVPLPMFQLWAIFFKYWGISLGTLRSISVLFGVLSVLSAYFFFRYFWGRGVAFLTTLLMSFSYWHLHYSRFGHTLIQQVFFQMVAFYFAWRGFRSGRFRDFAVGGVAFGLAMLPHLASRLLPFQATLLLVYFLLTRRDILRSRITGLLVFIMTAWMATAPSLVYWVRVIPLSMGRAQSVSIFDKTNTNAPVDTLAGFVSNSKVSALMFNYQGDTRHRNNPLAPQKILESATAVLFALGLLFALYHWRDPLHFFALTCFFINLCASIFSVEAPQTLRTAGNISIVFIFVAVLAHAIQRAFEGVTPRWGRQAFFLVSLPLVAWFSYRSGAKYFIERKDLTFDLVPTIVAERAGEVSGKGYDAVFAATGFAASHPPVMLFAEDTPIRNYYSAAEFLPLTGDPERGVIVALCDDYQRLAPWVQSLYPEAAPEVVPDPRGAGGPMVTFFDVSPAILAKNRGLAARSGGRDLGLQPLAWPLKGVPSGSSIEWTGSLMVEQYGSYSFSAQTAGSFTLYVDGREAARSENGRAQAPEQELAMGLHSLRAVFRPASATDTLAVTQKGSIIRAGRIFGLRASFVRPLEPRWLTPRQPSGFAGTYYASTNFKGEVQAQTVEPGLATHFLDSPILGGWSARWRSRLTVDKEGIHAFRLVTGAFAEVWVDGKPVSRVGNPPVPTLEQRPVSGPVFLRKGEHVVEIRFATTGYPWLDLLWTHPGSGSEELAQGPQFKPLREGF